MAYIREFGAYAPARVVSNAEVAERVAATPEWIRNVSGIEERRFAAGEESVASMAAAAARDCLSRAGMAARDLGLILMTGGSSPRQFPGPASQVAACLELPDTPAIDIPMASAGSLFAMALAAGLAATYGNVLVAAAEKMSAVAFRQPMERGVAPLFGDGAGACLISPDAGMARVVDSVLHSDGAFAEDLKLEWDQPLTMNGRTVILQASRKIPRAIRELLDRNGRSPASVDTFLMHQANQNLLDRVAQAMEVPEGRFFSNIRRYGNTSSASMLLAAAEWRTRGGGFRPGQLVCFAVFGAGFHWGALLAEGV